MAVWEISQITVADEGARAEFESAVQASLPALMRAEGCLDVRLLRAVDREGLFLFCILWESIEHHTEIFTKTETFAKMGAAITPFVSAPSAMFHAAVVIDGF
jgi:quinol monooxygenase YgiN